MKFATEATVFSFLAHLYKVNYSVFLIIPYPANVENMVSS